jgi:Spy/CpxP family protein refolding chaperone
MKKIKGAGLLALVALLTIGSMPSAAQDAERERRGPRRGEDIESIMSIRERLELTEDQLAQLDALRAEEVQRRSANRAEMEEMRSRLRAGQIERSEMMAFMEQRRDAGREASEDTRSRVDQVLGAEQRTQLDQIRAERRAFERGRRSAQREAGMRGERRGPRMERGFRSGRGASERGLRRGPRGPGGSGGDDAAGIDPTALPLSS